MSHVLVSPTGAVVKTSSLDLSRPELKLDIDVSNRMGNDHLEGLLSGRLSQLDKPDALVLVFELFGYEFPGTVRSERITTGGVIDGLRSPVGWSLSAEFH